MNKYIIVILVIFFCFATSFVSDSDNPTRQITVTGSADLSVEPDEIELEVTLMEYGSKLGKTKLKEIEKTFFKVLEKHRVDRKDVCFANQAYYWYYWWSYRNDSHKHKMYKMTLDESTDFLSLVQDLDLEGVRSLRIANSSNSNIQAFRKDVKIAAIRAAKDKAKYLLESIDERIGKLLIVEELGSSNNYWRSSHDAVSNVSIKSYGKSGSMQNIPSISLKYEVKAVFAIE